MISVTYHCDGCGTTTSEQQPVGWRACAPPGFDDQRRMKVPAQSHLCGDCWQGAMNAVHSRTLTRGLQVQVRSDTAEMAALPVLIR